MFFENNWDFFLQEKYPILIKIKNEIYLQYCQKKIFFIITKRMIY